MKGRRVAMPGSNDHPKGEVVTARAPAGAPHPRRLPAGVIGLMISLLTGCSFVIAAGGGDPGVDVSALRLGVARGEIEKTTGPPVTSDTDIEGFTINAYVFRTWRPPNQERALTNLAMDVVTLGLWELVGTANELILDPVRRERQFTLTFDREGRLVHIVPPVGHEEAGRLP